MRKRCSASFYLTTTSHLLCHVLLLHNDRCCVALPWGAGYHWWGRCRTQQRGTRMRTLPLLFLSSLLHLTTNVCLQARLLCRYTRLHTIACTPICTPCCAAVGGHRMNIPVSHCTRSNNLLPQSKRISTTRAHCVFAPIANLLFHVYGLAG